MALTLNKIVDYMKNDQNILIYGPAGTGKTHVLTEAASKLNLKMKYYSASTLDPYTDLVGIPVPQDDKTVKYYRPRDLDDAEVVFFDELNRADAKTLNTVFELIQKRSINGEKLPKLRIVVAAINPNDDGYTVDDLDIALMDRFNVYVEANPEISTPYFKERYGSKVAIAVTKFWNDYERSRTSNGRNNKNKFPYISPRRMDMIVDSYKRIPTRSTVSESLPMGASHVSSDLFVVLRDAMADNSKDTKKDTAMAPAKLKVSSHSNLPFHIAKVLNMTPTQIRSVTGRSVVQDAFHSSRYDQYDKKEASLLRNYVISALNNSVSPKVLVNQWGYVIALLSPSEVKALSSNWSNNKIHNFNREAFNRNLNYKSTGKMIWI